ncbi:putative hydrolase of the HAD superfamily [Murinocardiopsis flavida]|uniref:Putative hydrolase of the HAD superfamily n=1 Tax=Murinocardiopsis flavida TaxID=645275 RepID=A0A2P8DRR7_9ACTN|nr:HAD-IA family hydrolase [Murinocardiopsis flavida]PSK99908.1 putative hydrolase of the HAD superfamily [Murinocardiopsis flavida]
MDVTGIRLLTFDVVGTLIDFERGIGDAVRTIAPTAMADVGDAALLDAFGRAEGVQQRRTPHLPFTQMLEPVYLRMATELGLPSGNGEAAALRASIPRWPAFPDSAEALAALGRRFRLVALTNADRWAAAHMAATLGGPSDNPFDDMVTAEDVGVNKPDPQMFAYCRGRQSVHGHGLADTLHVAQSQYHDIGVAARLGYRTCWIERRSGLAGTGATPAPAAVRSPDLHFTTLGGLARAVAGN